jgi:hypothetical protein
MVPTCPSTQGAYLIPVEADALRELIWLKLPKPPQTLAPAVVHLSQRVRDAPPRLGPVRASLVDHTEEAGKAAALEVAQLARVKDLEQEPRAEVVGPAQEHRDAHQELRPLHLGLATASTGECIEYAVR